MDDCLAALDLFDSKMSVVIRERTQLVTSIQTSSSVVPTYQAFSLSSSEPLDSLASALLRNVQLERNAHNLMSDYLCSRVLSPLQLAKAAAASYPYIPDVSAIVRSTKRWGTASSSASLLPR